MTVTYHFWTDYSEALARIGQKIDHIFQEIFEENNVL